MPGASIEAVTTSARSHHPRPKDMSRRSRDSKARLTHLVCHLLTVVLALGLPTAAWAGPPETDEPPLAAPAAAPAAQGESAPAPEALGDDQVVLNNGGMLRGQVVESMPDSHVTIVVAGETRRIEWAEVSDVKMGHFADNTAVEPAPQAAPAGEPEAAVGRPLVHMDVKGNKPVQLRLITSEGYVSGYNVSGRSMTFTTVCQSPCDRVIDTTGGKRFIVGNDMWTFSRKIDLSNEGPQTTLEVVRPGNTASRISGAVLFGLGLGGLISGPLLLLLESTRTAGAVITGVSVPLFAIGLPLMILGRAKARVRK